MQFTQGELTKQKFVTETAGLYAEFKVNTSIQMPTVIYQNQEYWCGEVGCSCAYSEDSKALEAGSYEEVIDGQITNFTVTDASYDGKIISVACTKNSQYIQA